MQTVKFARQRAVRLRNKHVLTYAVGLGKGDINNHLHWVVRAGVVVQ